MLNSEENREQTKEEEMPKKKTTRKPTRKRIHNPETGRYYQIRQRSSSKGQKGTIMGAWSPPTKRKPKRKGK